MCRCLAILLLVFLPLQFSWAAVASYCAHETGAATNHVGHHDHAGHSHVSKDVDPGHKGKADGKTSNAPNLDCGHCLGHCAGIIAMATSFESQALASAPLGLSASPSAEHMPAQPERPQWATLA